MKLGALFPGHAEAARVAALRDDTARQYGEDFAHDVDELNRVSPLNWEAARRALLPRVMAKGEPTPAQLWVLADAENLGDPAARSTRYLDLMREHGHIVKAKPGESRSLPCGWPGR